MNRPTQDTEVYVIVTQAGLEPANFGSADQAFTNKQQGPAGRTTTTTTLIEEGSNILLSTVGERWEQTPFFWRPHHATLTGAPQSQK